MKKRIILACLSVVGLSVIGFVIFQFLGNRAQDTQQRIDLSAETRIQPGAQSNELQVESQKQPNNPRPDEFPNGQKYKIFTTEDFEVKYPYWPGVDLKGAPNTENIKLAVTDRGCVFMIKVSPIPADTTFKAYIEKLIEDQMVPLSIKILIKDIGESKAHLEGEIVMSGTTMKNVSYTYLTGKNQSAGIAFVANKNNFNEVCQPIVNEVVESAVVK